MRKQSKWIIYYYPSAGDHSIWRHSDAGVSQWSWQPSVQLCEIQDPRHHVLPAQQRALVLTERSVCHQPWHWSHLNQFAFLPGLCSWLLPAAGPGIWQWKPIIQRHHDCEGELIVVFKPCPNWPFHLSTNTTQTAHKLLVYTSHTEECSIAFQMSKPAFWLACQITLCFTILTHQIGGWHFVRKFVPFSWCLWRSWQQFLYKSFYLLWGNVSGKQGSGIQV